MNKPGRFVAVVAGITLAEMLLCFWWPLPTGWSRSVYEWSGFALVYIVVVADGLLISIALHGRRQLRRRILTAYFAPLLVAAPFVGWYWVCEALRYAPEANTLSAGLLWLISLVALSGSVVRKLWKRTRNRGIELDAVEWLRQRSKPRTERETRASRRTLAAALIIPAVVVLTASLFLHELIAIRSHVVHPGRTTMGAYRISVPWLWMVLWHDSDNVYGGVPRGTVRAHNGYFRVPIGRWSDSEWYVRNETPGRWYPDQREPSFFMDFDFVEARDVAFSGGTMHCTRYIPKRPFSDQPELTVIRCAGPQTLFAGFGGDPRDGELFYRVIRDIEVVR